MRLHFITSLVNSGLVTIATSLAMTFKNSPNPSLPVWIANWVISWAIVCTFVYYAAPRIARWLREKHDL